MPLRIRLILFAVVLASSGCESQFDRLDTEFGEAASRKKASVDAVLESVKELPDASLEYIEWVEAKVQLENIMPLADSDQLDDATRELIRKQLADREEIVGDLGDKVAIDTIHKINFTDGESRNAATILLSTDASTKMDDDFRDRNEGSARWYVHGPSGSDVEDAEDWYRLLTSLEYLLVIRESDIVKPEHQGQDSQGAETYSMGAIECDAFLFHVDDGVVISSFHFAAPNQQSALSFVGYEFFLPDDPAVAVQSLTDRLYGTAHDFAAAIAAELSTNIQSDYHVERDLLGVRLEIN